MTIDEVTARHSIIRQSTFVNHLFKRRRALKFLEIKIRGK
jgi:hypothetical protein